MKSFLIFAILFSFGFIFNHANAQQCCPDFQLQFSKFRCESPDCKSNVTGDGAQSVSLVMCQYSTNRIQVIPGITPGFTYAWSVTGGTINGNALTSLSTSLPYIDVTWSGATLGTITVSIFNGDSSCFKKLTQKFCLTQSPRAQFVKNTGDTVCKNQPILFTNNSLGVYTNWTWNFGDGNTQNGGMNATHNFSNTGVYIVSLTVNNSDNQGNCGCSTTFYDTITVINSNGLKILTPDCRKMLCAGDTVTYCANITNCSNYNWSALGGMVIGSGSCIRVVWNNLTSALTQPTVTLTVPPSCAGFCSNSTSLVENILYNGMPIQGNNIVCLNASNTFTLPSLPGVFYTWSVSPATNFSIINGTNINTPALGVSFSVAGTYILKCVYIDSLRNCSGVSSLSIQVRPPFSIVGPNTSCATCTSSFTTNPVGTFNWSINTLPVSTASGASITKTWTATQTGNYIVTATQIGTTFCNSPKQTIINVSPKPVLSIFRSSTVSCPGTIIKFWVSSNVQDVNVNWTYPAGTQVLNNTGSILDTLYVIFSTGGTKTVTATQFCSNSCTSTSISTTVSNPTVPVLASPQTTVCIDQVVNYSVASPLPGITYTWSITNANLGTIQSGQGTPNVTILWHGNASNSGQLRVSHCGGMATANIIVTLPPAVSISQSGSCLSNGNGYTLTAIPSGQTYFWSTGATSQSINATSAGVYSVTVNPNANGSCPVTKSIEIKPDAYVFIIAPPCIVSNCNLNNFSIPLSQIKFIMPCSPTYQWYFKPVNGIAFNPILGANASNYNATQLGCYYSVATCANGCNVTSNTICIPDDVYFCCATPSCNSLTFGISFNQINCNPTQFTGFITGTGTPSGNLPVYYCYGDGTSSLETSLNAVHQYSAAGQYTVCISQKTLVSNAPNPPDTCCITDCRTIDVPVVADFNASYNCTTGLLSMSDASSYYPNSSGASYTWTITGGTFTGSIGNVNSGTVTPTSSGNFSITLTVIKGSCTATFNKVVQVAIPIVSYTINPNPTCSKDITYFVTTPGFASYNWQFGDGAYSFAAPSANPQHQYTNNTSSPINFTSTLTITTLDGCTATQSQIVSVHPKPIATITPKPDTICRGGSVVLIVNINSNGNGMCSSYIYQWRKNGINISGANAPSYIVTDFGAYSVFVSGSNSGCNCTFISDTALVSYYPEPIANIETASTICFDTANNPVSFAMNATNYSGYTYNWSSNIPGISFFPNGTNNGLTDVTGVLQNNNSFVIYLQVTDSNGCSGYDSLCMFSYTNPTVTIGSNGTLCSKSINNLNVITPSTNLSYSWNTGANSTSISTTLPGNYNTIAIDMISGCTGYSNNITINASPSLELFPIGCDTVCDDEYISIPLAQLPNLSDYQVYWYDGIQPLGTLVYSGSGAITLPANSLSLGIHHLWTVATFPDGCTDTSGILDVFIKKCCICAGSSWKQRDYSINGATVQPLICNQQEIVLNNCNTLFINASYSCSPNNCAGAVTGVVLNMLGNVTSTISSMPYTFTPTPGTAGNFYIRLYGWCDGVVCDSCTKLISYNCPIVEPPCGCDTAFHFTGTPIVVIPFSSPGIIAGIIPGIISGGNPVSVNCGSTYADSLTCFKNYQFYINYQNPWTTGNCNTTVVGQILQGTNVIYSQNNISQTTPMNYAFTGQGLYCVKFKLMVNGVACDSCTICFNVRCQTICKCKEEFYFTGSPVIMANLIGGQVSLAGPFTCNSSTPKPLKCNTNYSFYINYANPYTLPCVAKDSAVIVQTNSLSPLVINPNTTMSNPISYTFNSSGLYLVKHYLVLNGTICDSCILRFNIECPSLCDCSAFDFLTKPTITFVKGIVKNVPIISTLTSPCETSLAKQLQCKRAYKFFILAGPIASQIPVGCTVSVKAILLFNNVAIATMNNVSPSNPLTFTFSKGGIYCIRYELYVNGVLCKTCLQCFQVNCCPIVYVLPALRGNFVGCEIGGTTRIYNDSVGGVFRSLDTTIAQVNEIGLVTAVGYGTTIIEYQWIKNPCDYYALAEYTVPRLTPLPAITGSGAICKVGDSSKLMNTVTLGTWSISNSSVAQLSAGTSRINSTQVRARSAGTAVVQYTTSQSGCSVSTSKEIIVHPIVMNNSTGPTTVCTGQRIQWENNTLIPSGFTKQWLSTSTRATVNNNGLITGVTAGAAGIRYQLNYQQSIGSCSTSVLRDVLVVAPPAIPTITVVTLPKTAPSSTSICSNQRFQLRSSVLGGVWTSAGSLQVDRNGFVTTLNPGIGTVTYTVYNTNGCSNSRTLTYQVVSCNGTFKAELLPLISNNSDIPVSVNDSKIKIYPNPTRNELFIRVAPSLGDGVVMLTDLQGKVLQQARFRAGTQSIPTWQYSSGMYFLVFRTKQGVQTEKLMIE